MRRLVWLLLMCVLIGLMGCKSNKSPSDDGGVNAPEKPDGEAPISLSGRVVTGFPANASIRIFANGINDRVIADSVNTDSNGAFTLAIDSKYLTLPAVIEVSIVAGQTQLRCMLPSGCEQGAPYGGVFTSDENLTLSAAIPSLKRQGNHNISLLTDLAFQRALAELSQFSSDIGSATTLKRQQIFAQENSRVASRFNIIGDMTSLAVLDFTDLEQVKQGSWDSLYYSAFGAAILEAVKKERGTVSMVTAYRQFSDEFLTSGVADNTEIIGAVSYSDILDALIGILEPYENQVGFVDLLIRELSAARALAISEKPDQFDQGVSSDTVGLSLVGRAKAFVQDIRQVASSIDLAKIASPKGLSGFLDGQAASALEAFGLKIDAAEILSGDDPQYLGDALAKVGAALLKVSTDYYLRGVTSPQTVDGVYVGINDLEGSLAEFVVNQTVSVCEIEVDGCSVNVDLIVRLNPDRISGSGGDNLTLNAKKLNIRLSGTASNSNLIMTIVPGAEDFSFRDLYVNFTNESSGSVDNTKLVFEGSRAEGAMRVIISRVDLPEAVAVNAVMELEADNVLLEYLMDEFSTGGGIGEGSSVESKNTLILHSLDNLVLNLGCVIERGAEESFLAGVGAKVSKPVSPNIIEYLTHEVVVCDAATPPQCITTYDASALNGESDADFMQVKLATVFKANLKGVVEPVFVTIAGGRESAVLNKIDNLKVTYPGSALKLSGQFNNGGGITSMTATNLDGMSMFIDTGTNRKRFGSLTGPLGEVAAELLDMGDWIKVIYEDGEFVSL